MQRIPGERAARIDTFLKRSTGAHTDVHRRALPDHFATWKPVCIHFNRGWRNGVFVRLFNAMVAKAEIENIPPWDTPEGWYVVTRWLHNGSMQEEETQTTQHRCYHEGLCPLLKHLE